ncbi:MAG TPA: DUF1634 domain-containing protein [Nitrococcus sp.]|nr:DUF1634 domain-containing protein [Nitrococcus sp.]
MAVNVQLRLRDAEQRVGILLKWGLLLSCVLLVSGLTLYLAIRWGRYHVELGRHADAVRLGDLGTWLKGIHQRSLGLLLMQTGLLVLVGLQVVRVASYGWLFLVRREWPYVAMTLFLSALILYGLL